MSDKIVWVSLNVGGDHFQDFSVGEIDDALSRQRGMRVVESSRLESIETVEKDRDIWRNKALDKRDLLIHSSAALEAENNRLQETIEGLRQRIEELTENETILRQSHRWLDKEHKGLEQQVASSVARLSRAMLIAQMLFDIPASRLLGQQLLNALSEEPSLNPAETIPPLTEQDAPPTIADVRPLSNPEEWSNIVD